MAMTNAERHARWRARHKQEVTQLRANAARVEEQQQPLETVLVTPPPPQPRPYDKRNGGAPWLKSSKERDAIVEAATDVPDEKTFKRGLFQRTRAAREAAGLSQANVFQALRVPRGTYEKWEKENQMPVRYMPTFVRLVGITYEYLLEGK